MSTSLKKNWSIRTQLGLLLALAVMLSVLAIGGVVVWNLQHGFSDYLRARDAAQAARLAELVAQKSKDDSTMEWLRADYEAMRELMVEFSTQENLRIPVGGANGRQANLATDTQRAHRPPVMGASIGPRVQIFDAQGQWVAGRKQPPEFPRLSQNIVVAGTVVGTVQVTVLPDEGGVDVRFLKRQYAGLAIAALSTIVMSFLLGSWVVRRWMQPLKQAQVATHRIAQGEFDVRLSNGGAFEFQQLSTDINQMARSLKHLEASRRLWIAQSAHELRTPLSVLLGGIESIQDGVKQPTPGILENLRQEVLHLNRLVNDLHVLSVADLQSLPCTFLKGDASALIFRIAANHATRLQQKGLLLSLDGPKNLEVLWDFGRIEQLVSNLLENSLRHTTAPGQIRLSWKLTESQAKAEVLLVIQDSAPGVTHSECLQVFEPLFKVDKARVEHADGYVSTGLGLAVVRAIVQAHSGKVTANPSPLGGLEIVVQLPQTVSENSLKAS